MVDSLSFPASVAFTATAPTSGTAPAPTVVEFSVSANHDGAALPAWRALPSVESVREDDGLIALNVKQPHLTIPALLETIDKRGGKLQHLTTRQASLEDVFVSLTGRHLRGE